MVRLVIEALFHCSCPLSHVSDIRPTRVLERVRSPGTGHCLQDPSASAWWPSPRAICPAVSCGLAPASVVPPPLGPRCLLLVQLAFPFPVLVREGEEPGSSRMPHCSGLQPAMDSSGDAAAP